MLNELYGYQSLCKHLLSLRNKGVWTGALASSALSTALTLVALGQEASAAQTWLLTHVNKDGGWGDTPESLSNLSTTLIVRDALIYAERMHIGDAHSACCLKVRQRADAWIATKVENDSIDALVQALSRIYGHDRTFAVPILAFHAICTATPGCWSKIPPLPFLFALLPRGFYRMLRLHVVSYAMPALIAIGLCRSIAIARENRRFNWAVRFAPALLRKMRAVQPSHGGFLDASPLTAFVCIALRHAGFEADPVCRDGCAFLRQSLRPDGSTAIDSNLRNWVTSLAVRSLLVGPMAQNVFSPAEHTQLIRWYCDTQQRTQHPFTGSKPGGWAWTNLPGGVPDADDTSAALLALHLLAPTPDPALREVIRNGLTWLISIQNNDGGMPTFCRGWGKLPFDQSCPDITAHALHACARWTTYFATDATTAKNGVYRLEKAIAKMITYLHNTQHLDGRWDALWFGHQAHPQGKNAIIGTARVVDALRQAQHSVGTSPHVPLLIQKGCEWLDAQQLEDGSWSIGEKGTIEETALATSALAGSSCDCAARRGAAWLNSKSLATLSTPAPIGLYFSLLWYHEQLYPLVWALEALGKFENGMQND